ncbi:glycosyltransferase [Acetobacter estunensis]|uniref:glycosyltransferase n=1 Tax=Acetobacter estunensis TaxID=104097 RepID=UPI0020C492DA|nr:glycosyltransferase [Acetobacter estunensis]
MSPDSERRLHPLHRLWRCLPAAPRRRGLAEIGGLLAPRATWPAPRVGDGLIVGGETTRASGLGEGARVMRRACKTLDIPATELQASLLDGTRAQKSLTPDAALVLHMDAPSLPVALLRLGRSFVRNRRVVGYWAWELPVVPTTWRPATACVHEVWTPSRFSAHALETIMPGRVRVVPHALAAADVTPSRMDRATFGLPANAVVVLVSFSLASSFARKNPLAAIRAFRDAFGERSDRFLLLKVTHARHYPQDMAQLRAAVAGASNIRIEERLFPANDSLALTQCVDIVLSLHRSEGFGLVPAEAMLLGRTVVATDWSATAEFLDAECGLPVPYRLIPARDPRGVFEAEGAVWAEADVRAATTHLRRAADDAALRQKLGSRARDVARQRFNGDELRAAYAALRGDEAAVAWRDKAWTS